MLFMASSIISCILLGHHVLYVHSFVQQNGGIRQRHDPFSTNDTMDRQGPSLLSIEIPLNIPKQRSIHVALQASSDASESIEHPEGKNMNGEINGVEESVEGKGPDSLLQFSKDVEHVIHNLRGAEVDPTLPKMFLERPRALSFTHSWTLDDWERHNSRKRYFRYVVNFPTSRLLKRTAPQMVTLTLWSVCSTWIIDKLMIKKTIPLTSLGIISSFVAFLLTMRSNMGLARLDEGRKAWSKVVLQTREMASLISSFIYPLDKQLALMLARHVACFGWLLKSQLRSVPKEDVADIVNTMLPNKADAEYVLAQRQKPIVVVTRIRQAIHHLGKQGKLTTAEEMALDHTAHALSEVVTTTGRIRASPIPTLYTSHTTRLLTFYLFFLPPALHWSGLDRLITILVTWAVGYAMLGLDELSHLCEQPFRVMPMYQISKRSMTAVADAFTCRPPPLDGEHVDDEVKTLSQKELTIYWNKQDADVVTDDEME